MKGNNKIKSLLILVVIITTMTPALAKFEAWVGTGLTAHTASIDKSEEKNFKSILDKFEEPISIENVIFMGPSLDTTIFPNYDIPIGLRLSSEILFPIGFNKDNGYRSYNGDFKNRNLIGISYAQTYGNGWGLYAEFGYEYDIYRIAQSNKQNYRPSPEYNIFFNNNLFGEFGILATIEKGYFKLGINYSHSVENKASSHDLIFAGGYRF